MGGTRRLLRAHYNPVNWSRKYPNLQYAVIDGKRMLVCTNCLRTSNKVRVKKTVRTSAPAAAVAA